MALEIPKLVRQTWRKYDPKEKQKHAAVGVGGDKGSYLNRSDEACSSVKEIHHAGDRANTPNKVMSEGARVTAVLKHLMGQLREIATRSGRTKIETQLYDASAGFTHLWLHHWVRNGAERLDTQQEEQCLMECGGTSSNVDIERDLVRSAQTLSKEGDEQAVFRQSMKTRILLLLFCCDFENPDGMCLDGSEYQLQGSEQQDPERQVAHQLKSVVEAVIIDQHVTEMLCHQSDVGKDVIVRELRAKLKGWGESCDSSEKCLWEKAAALARKWLTKRFHKLSEVPRSGQTTLTKSRSVDEENSSRGNVAEGEASIVEPDLARSGQSTSSVGDVVTNKGLENITDQNDAMGEVGREEYQELVRSVLSSLDAELPSWTLILRSEHEDWAAIAECMRNLMRVLVNIDEQWEQREQQRQMDGGTSEVSLL